MHFDEFIYGKDQTQGIVSIEIDNNVATLYKQDGSKEDRKNEFWILLNKPVDSSCISLDGAAHYSYAKKYDDSFKFYQDKRDFDRKGVDYYCVYNQAEQFMIKTGVTCHLGMEPKDLSVLSFDIETTGLKHDKDAKVLLIATTLRKGGKLERRLFAYDEYANQKEFINDFCKYVRDADPTVITGHNILNFDFPYLVHCGGELRLGKDGSKAKTAKYPSKIRKDQNSFYEYYNVTVRGRQVVDTFNLSIKYDTARNYPSYGLKAIIKHEGLERQNRQHYDASQIYKKYRDPSEWAKIKEYATDDGDDALKLFDLMIPAYFYFCQSVPRGLQHVVNSNSGAQVNSFLVRTYLQEGMGVPKADEPIRYEGGISYGEPGVYESCFKVDVASLYPSIILNYSIENSEKDPDGHFMMMVAKFTASRLANKKLAAHTGERSYKDKSDAEKIFINSAYGFMNAKGLNFNYPEGAKRVCRIGRHLLTKGINIATRRGLGIVNADTDSFMVHGFDGALRYNFVKLLNSKFKKGIVWEDDGYYASVLVLKAKNYVMLDEDENVSTKGAAIKATGKEPALRKFINEVVNALLRGEREYDILNRYNRLARDIHRIDRDSIADWCAKKTVTEKVLNPKRTQEARVKEAIQEAGLVVKEGDKIHVFFEDEDKLCVQENFKGVYSKHRLATKLYNTMAVFKSVLDLDGFPKYHLKRNQETFEQLRGNPGQDYPGLHGAKAQLSIFEERVQ